MQKAIYTTVGIDELLLHVQALKGVGARFVQMHAERNVDDGTYRLVYTFINVRAAQEHIAQDGSYAIENLVVEGIDQYQEIPSISSYYPAVFPFENEAHDLFGLAITDMQIDFKGFFYQVSTAEPMSVITPEVKAAREKAMKVRAAAEAKARKAAAEKAAAAAAAAGEGAAGAGGAAGAVVAQPAAAAGSDAQHDEAAAKAALKAAEMEAKLAAARRLPPRPPATSRKRRRKVHGTSLRYSVWSAAPCAARAASPGPGDRGRPRYRGNSADWLCAPRP